MSTTHDKRQYVRFELEIPANLTIMDGDREADIRELITRDICAAGSYFPTDDPLPLGTQVKMDLILPLSDLVDLQANRSRARLKVVGSVVRSSDNGMALKFEIEKIVIDDNFGMVRDLESRLEWFTGPGVDMNWRAARDWVDSLSAEGGRWRMPTGNELASLFEPESNRYFKIDRVFHLTAANVWCDTPPTGRGAKIFNFIDGELNWRPPEEARSGRAMAVRDCDIRDDAE